MPLQPETRTKAK